MALTFLTNLSQTVYSTSSLFTTLLSLLEPTEAFFFFFFELVKWNFLAISMYQHLFHFLNLFLPHNYIKILVWEDIHSFKLCIFLSIQLLKELLQPLTYSVPFFFLISFLNLNSLWFVFAILLCKRFYQFLHSKVQYL